MTVTTLISNLRAVVNDIVQTGSLVSLYTDAELIFYTNMAYGIMVGVINRANPGHFETDLDFSTNVAGVPTDIFTLPTDFSSLKELLLSDSNQFKVNVRSLTQVRAGNDLITGADGEPVAYRLRAGSLVLLPKPNKEYFIRLTYERELTDLQLTAPTTVPFLGLIPERFHYGLVMLAKHFTLTRGENDDSPYPEAYLKIESGLIAYLRQFGGDDPEPRADTGVEAMAGRHRFSQYGF
jgi:hypothetical protein